MPTPELLYHYTCSHGATGIDATMQLTPHAHPMLGVLGPIVWLTDIADPVVAAFACGFFPRVLLTCDRSETRFTVPSADVADLQRWNSVRERFSTWTLSRLEAGAMPDHWWLSQRPIRLRSFA